MGKWRRIPVLAGFIALAGLFACSQSGLSPREATAPMPARANISPALAWPPAEVGSRTASDDTVTIYGAQSDSTHGAATVNSNSLQLGPDAGDLCYALYSLGGFGTDIVLDSVSLQCAIAPASQDDSTALYVGLSNYAKGYWEWYIAAPMITFNLPNSDDYLSPAGTIHVAAVLGGPGTAQVDRFTFDRTGSGAVVPAPANLTGEAHIARIHLDWDDVPNAEGYYIYRSAQPNFAQASKLIPQLTTDSTYEDNTVIETWQYYYWVTAVRGPESSESNMLSIISASLYPDVPQNLVGVGDFGRVALNWDVADGAVSYRVQRADNPDFTSAKKFVAPNNVYLDSSMTKGMYHYYRVSGFGVVEGDPSSAVRVFAPENNLPAPQNFRVEPAGTGGDSVTLAWDWADADPGGFRIYIGTTPDFDLATAYRREDIYVGDQRSIGETELPSDTTCYAVMCATDGSGTMGHMTAQISFHVESYWTWAPSDDFAYGHGPIDAVSTNGEILMGYFTNDDLRVAHRTNAGVWTTETSGLNGTLSEAGFGNYMDIAYGGGKYILGGYATLPADMWVATGVPGSWTTHRVHGDGSPPPDGAPPPSSGINFQVAASDTQFAVTHLFIDTQQVLLESRPISGTDSDWIESVIQTGQTAPMAQGLGYFGSNLFCLMDMGDNLQLADQDHLFAWNTISSVTGGYAQFVDLFDLGGSPAALAYDPGSETLDYVRDPGTGWAASPAVDGWGALSGISGVALGNQLMVVYKYGDPSEWFYSLYNGSTWQKCKLLTPEAPEAGAELVNVDGVPYVIYFDFAWHIHCSQGIPPS